MASLAPQGDNAAPVRRKADRLRIRWKHRKALRIGHDVLPQALGRLRSRLLVVASSLVILLGTACSGTSSEDRFAERMCSTTLASAEAVLALIQDVRGTRAAPGADSWALLVGLADQGVEVTRRHTADVILIPAPDTSSGKQAKAFFVDDSRLQNARLTEEARRVQQLPQNLTLLQSIRALNNLETALAEVIGFMVSSKGGVVQQVPELGDAFGDADSCEALDNLGRPSS